MFRVPDFEAAHRAILGDLGIPVTLKVNTGSGFKSYTGAVAWVREFKENELIPGGTIKTGDMRLVFLGETIPATITRLEMGDRVEIEGKDYSVLTWDTQSRTAGSTKFAVEAAVRG